MSGPKRNPDSLNTIGVVVVGICGAVLVYVSIVALQAFYMNDSSEVQTMADYGGQDTTHKSIRATQIGNITEYAPNPRSETGAQTYRIGIDRAIKLVADGAKVDPGNLVPTQGRANQPTIVPAFGRPSVATPPPSGPDGAGGAQGGGANPGTGAPGNPGAATPGAASGGASATMSPTGGAGPGGGPPPGQSPTASPAGSATAGSGPVAPPAAASGSGAKGYAPK